VDLVSVKRSLIDLIRCIEAPAYIAKFMDEFFTLPTIVQVNFVNWVSLQCDRKEWSELAEDETLLLKAVRSIIFFHSGREDLKQPSKDDLKKLIGDYLRESGWEKLEEDKKKAEEAEEKKDEFIGELEEL